MSLSVTNLSVNYGAHNVLEQLQFKSLTAGTFTGLLGPNAAGKSTLFKAIAGLIDSSGEISLNAENIGSYSKKIRAKKIAYLPQSFHSSLALSVFESILLSLKQQSGWRVSSADLNKVGDILSLLNISSLADKDIFELSGGQKQLVAMARILIVEPQVILLDEPTSALDLHHQLAILSLVKKLTVERNLITVAALHDVNLAAKYCDQLMILNHGTIQAQGQPSEVLSQSLLGETYQVWTNLERTSKGQLYVEAELIEDRLATAG